MSSRIKHLTLATVVITALVAGNSLSARAATPSETRPGAAIERGAPTWTWPIDKEARSPVWTEARSAKDGAVRVEAWRSALRKSALLGGL
jgi:hypothetical protein